MKANRRSFLAIAGVSVMGAAGLRSLPVLAQSDPASPYAFGDSTSLTWADPWTYQAQVTDAPYADSVFLASGQATLGVGYFSAPTDIKDWIAFYLALGGLNETVAPEVAGGGGSSIGADGVTESQSDYHVHIYRDGDQTLFGIYFQTVDQLNATSLIAPVAEFASFVESAQASVMLDGTPVLADVDGAKIQADMEGGVGRLESESDTDGSTGEYTDGSGNLTVTWPDGWTVASQSDVGLELANPEQTVILNLQTVAFDGRTWEQAAQDDIDWLAGDQGPNATVTGPTVTEIGYLFASDGDYGLRLVQGIATEDDLDYYVLVFAGNMEANGADALEILEQIQADITVNGRVPMQGLDTFIDMSES